MIQLTRPFDGNVEASFEMAATVLAANNFRLVQKTVDTIEFTGAGMSSTRQNPLHGATQLRFVHRPGHLTLEAELGGLTRLTWFLHLFPPLLGISMLILFSFLFRHMGWWFVVGVSLGPIAPWIVLAPLLSRWTRRRAIDALETVLANVAAAGKGPA